MNKKYTNRSFAFALVLLGGLLLGNPPAAFAEGELTVVERPLSAFELQALDGAGWSVDSLAGKPWIVNFWATWCPPCIEELPSLNRAWQQLSPEGVGMLAINAGEGEAAVSEFLTRINIDFTVLLGNGDTLPNWSVRVLPTTLIVDAGGMVRYEVLGPREWDDQEVADAVLALTEQ